MTLKEAEQRRTHLLKKAKELHLTGLTVGQINRVLSEEYDLAYDSSYNTKSADLMKIRLRFIYWIESACCNRVNNPHYEAIP